MEPSIYKTTSVSKINRSCQERRTYVQSIVAEMKMPITMNRMDNKGREVAAVVGEAMERRRMRKRRRVCRYCCGGPICSRRPDLSIGGLVQISLMRFLITNKD